MNRFEIIFLNKIRICVNIFKIEVLIKIKIKNSNIENFGIKGDNHDFFYLHFLLRQTLQAICSQ